MKKELKLVIQLKSRFISVNSLYKAKVLYKFGKPIASLYKNPKANDIEHEIREQLRALDLTEYKEWLTNTKGFKLFIQFIFKKNISNSDVSNYIKNLEDILTRYIKEDLGIDNYDDSKHIEISAVKSIIPKSKHEYACVQLTESTFNTRLDQIEKPEKFYLGGEIDSDNDWKKELIPELDKRGYSYFCPISKEQDKDEINKCNSYLFILTPKIKDMFSLAKIINLTWECITSGKGFIYVGIIGSISDWGEDKYNSLKEYLLMINNISSGNSRIKTGFINNTIDILNL